MKSEWSKEKNTNASIVELKPDDRNTGTLSRILTIKNCNFEGKEKLGSGKKFARLTFNR